MRPSIGSKEVSYVSKETTTTPFFAMQTIGEREEQEDSYGVCYDFLVPDAAVPVCFVLADGMGGHTGGSIASQTAIDSVKLVVESCETLDDRTLFDCLAAANLNIAECLKVDPTLEGMGTTLVVLTIVDGHVFWVSVGDSPLLLFDKHHELHLLNEDHSMRPVLDKLVESGVMTKQSPEYQKKVNQLRSALTGEKIEIYDLNTIGVPLAEYRYIVLASDGLDTLSRDEVRKILSEFDNKGAKEIASELVTAVDGKRASKQDNTTLIVIDLLTYQTSYYE